MNNIAAISASESLAREFAAQLNDSPDRDNWSELDSNDDLPEFDYVALREQFGEVTREMKAAYIAAFNAALS